MSSQPPYGSDPNTPSPDPPGAPSAASGRTRHPVPRLTRLGLLFSLAGPPAVVTGLYLPWSIKQFENLTGQVTSVSTISPVDLAATGYNWCIGVLVILALPSFVVAVEGLTTLRGKAPPLALRPLGILLVTLALLCQFVVFTFLFEFGFPSHAIYTLSIGIGVWITLLGNGASMAAALLLARKR